MKELSLQYIQKQTSSVFIGKNLSIFEGKKHAVAIYDSRLSQDKLSPILKEVSHSIPLMPSEAIKERSFKAKIEDELLEKNFGAKTLFIAIGGGSLLDLVGFVAATYFRGCPLWLVPTSLLSMCDSAIGGKNGVNASGTKNAIGTIYQPEKVFIDIDFIKSLPKSEMQNGLMEMIKHALLGQFPLDIESILAKDEKALLSTIEQNVAYKIALVENSRDNPKRRDLLNFGHTVGHALELLSHFSLSHGKAIAFGLLCECHLGNPAPSQIDKVESLINRVGMPLELPRIYSFDEWMRAMQRDRKTRDDKPRFVLFDRDGKPIEKEGEVCHEVDHDKLKEVLLELNKRYVS